MKKLGAIVLLVAIAVSASVGSGEAGWKKRGWYVKKQGAHCTMRKVTVVGANGRVVVQKIRVCR
jgi:hypothetical protein